MIRPYDGKEGYLFISYSHKDIDRVMPIVSRIHELGYNVWYDEGIDPGTEWADTIALHIEECSIFIAFLTRSFIESKNCLDELDYARDKGVKQILIYLEELELTRGLAMRTNRIQAFYKYRYPDEDSFYTRFNETDELKKLRRAKEETEKGTEPVQAASPRNTVSVPNMPRKENGEKKLADTRQTSSGKSSGLKILLSVAGIVAVSGVAVAFFMKPKPDNEMPHGTTAPVTASITAEPTEVPSPTPTIEPTATLTVKPTATPSPTPTVKPTATPSPTPTVKPTEVPSTTPTIEPTATPSPTPTVKPTATPSPTSTVKPTATPSPTPTLKPTATPSPTPTVKPTATPSPTPTVKPTATPSPTPTVKPTATPSPTPTVKPTATPSPTPTATPSPTPTVKPTATPSPTPTVKPTATSSPTPTVKPTATPSPTLTVKPTATPSPTPTVKPTATPSPTLTARPTATPKPTPTVKPTATPGLTKTGKLTATPEKAVESVQSLPSSGITAIDSVRGLSAAEVKETEITLAWEMVEGAEFYEASIKESEDQEDGWNTIRVRYPEVTFSGLTKNTKYDFKVCAGAGERYSREAFLLNCSTDGAETDSKDGKASSSAKHGRLEDLPVTIVTTRSKILLRPEPNENGKNGPDNVGPDEILSIFGVYKDSRSGAWYVRISQKALQLTNKNESAGIKFVQGYVPIKYTDLKDLSEDELKRIHEEAIAVGASETEILDDVYNGDKPLPAIAKVIGRDINLRTLPGSAGEKSKSVVKGGTDVDVLELVLGDDDQYYISVRANIVTNPNMEDEKTVTATGYMLVKYTDLVDRVKN